MVNTENLKALMWRRNNPDKYKEQYGRLNNDINKKEYKKFWRLYNRYKLSREDFENLLKNQNYVCAICKEIPLEHENGYCVDHDHQTNIVRGILCQKCNAGLGLFRDSPEFLSNAIKYLKGPQNGKAYTTDDRLKTH
jgi:hypothetical protein